jgi:D-alanyl-lipoteichoic acid acyltransferase DltB (MBOAT superfamily)
MLFNHFEFLIFLPIVFFIYWFVLNKRINLQNSFLLLSSYVFYGYSDYRFLSLVLIGTIIDFYLGRKIESTELKKRKKAFVLVSVLTNIGILLCFKYYNFFIDSFVELFSNFGYIFENNFFLNIILAVGISFYSFQTLSYSIDVHKEKISFITNILEKNEIKYLDISLSLYSNHFSYPYKYPNEHLNEKGGEICSKSIKHFFTKIKTS